MTRSIDARPSANTTLMDCALVWAGRSTCGRSQVGVVIASEDNRILVTGYNGAPAGMPHCHHTCTCGLSAPYPRVKLHEDGCHFTRPCETAVHAEANAIAYAARCGIRVGDATLYTTFSPCLKCAQLIVNAGIIKVVYLAEYRIIDGLDLLATAGVDVVRYTHDR